MITQQDYTKLASFDKTKAEERLKKIHALHCSQDDWSRDYIAKPIENISALIYIFGLIAGMPLTLFTNVVAFTEVDKDGLLNPALEKPGPNERNWPVIDFVENREYDYIRKLKLHNRGACYSSKWYLQVGALYDCILRNVVITAIGVAWHTLMLIPNLAFKGVTALMLRYHHWQLTNATKALQPFESAQIFLENTDLFLYNDKTIRYTMSLFAKRMTPKALFDTTANNILSYLSQIADDLNTCGISENGTPLGRLSYWDSLLSIYESMYPDPNDDMEPYIKWMRNVCEKWIHKVREGENTDLLISTVVEAANDAGLTELQETWTNTVNVTNQRAFEEAKRFLAHTPGIDAQADAAYEAKYAENYLWYPPFSAEYVFKALVDTLVADIQENKPLNEIVNLDQLARYLWPDCMYQERYQDEKKKLADIPRAKDYVYVSQRLENGIRVSKQVEITYPKDADNNFTKELYEMMCPSTDEGMTHRRPQSSKTITRAMLFQKLDTVADNLSNPYAQKALSSVKERVHNHIQAEQARENEQRARQAQEAVEDRARRERYHISLRVNSIVTYRSIPTQESGRSVCNRHGMPVDDHDLLDAIRRGVAPNFSDLSRGPRR